LFIKAAQTVGIIRQSGKLKEKLYRKLDIFI